MTVLKSAKEDPKYSLWKAQINDVTSLTLALARGSEYGDLKLTLRKYFDNNPLIRDLIPENWWQAEDHQSTEAWNKAIKDAKNRVQSMAAEANKLPALRTDLNKAQSVEARRKQAMSDKMLKKAFIKDKHGIKDEILGFFKEYSKLEPLCPKRFARVSHMPLAQMIVVLHDAVIALESVDSEEKKNRLISELDDFAERLKTQYP